MDPGGVPRRQPRAQILENSLTATEQLFVAEAMIMAGAQIRAQLAEGAFDQRAGVVLDDTGQISRIHGGTSRTNGLRREGVHERSHYTTGWTACKSGILPAGNQNRNVPANY